MLAVAAPCLRGFCDCRARAVGVCAPAPIFRVRHVHMQVICMWTGTPALGRCIWGTGTGAHHDQQRRCRTRRFAAVASPLAHALLRPQTAARAADMLDAHKLPIGNSRAYGKPELERGPSAGALAGLDIPPSPDIAMAMAVPWPLPQCPCQSKRPSTTRGRFAWRPCARCACVGLGALGRPAMAKPARFREI